MNIIFLQNCVSPHQMPYIKELATMSNVDRVIVVSPRLDYNARKEMGWEASTLLTIQNIEFLIAPSMKQIRKLYESCEEIETYCFSSGITAFKEIIPWMKLSFEYPFKRGIITEPPLLYNHPLWQHKVRFFLKDWCYVKYFNQVFVMGNKHVSYYKMWSKRWQVSPFMYCTEWRERTHKIPLSTRLKVLYVGSLSERKNMAWAFEILSQKVELEIGLVGDGEQRIAIEQMIPKAEAKVVMYGIQPMECMPEIMQAYDVLILPSKHDGWGAVVNEALTLGLYVICSNHCGASFLLEEELQGLVFNLEEHDSLSRVINNCIDKRDWIRKTVNARITWSKAHISGTAVAAFFMQQLVKQ